MPDHTIRLRCTTAYENHFERSGWQWSAVIDDGDAYDHSFELHGKGRCPYVEGREYEVTVREVNEEP